MTLRNRNAALLPALTLPLSLFGFSHLGLPTKGGEVVTEAHFPMSAIPEQSKDGSPACSLSAGMGK